ncbi:DUF2190 family protein [Pandoraea nosoerga]|uniref:DUF2190 domain-containing protein n=1 Tax=Pandoraea nosoerga TaxID=2508296 RepID=A0A5E4V1H4_9BURK|nr:capsid cement protein [Pandoraea nosoerga]MBN4667883.1 DUF2190 family protein [Pandoraea nosoerga]MBN4676512.1 DUF2190 family protein [Pandoraea nosoerga]MBN4682831.1 DUF2190 family protein [Pandoraea nosoerga]MBN4745708.1 DUF2190 family protein [Pandoraea nosoerga]VVE05643.1 hypothetical protein PNO31109_02352 [Pandoraea nosoerga]
MKTQQVVLTTSVIAATDLIRRRFVAFDGTVCAAGAKALGVVEADTEAGGVAPANILGAILVEAGGAIAAGAEVESDASGRAVTKAAGTSNGYAWDSAAAAGDLIRIVRSI